MHLLLRRQHCCQRKTHCKTHGKTHCKTHCNTHGKTHCNCCRTAADGGHTATQTTTHVATPAAAAAALPPMEGTP